MEWWNTGILEYWKNAPTGGTRFVASGHDAPPTLKLRRAGAWPSRAGIQFSNHSKHSSEVTVKGAYTPRVLDVDPEPFFRSF